MADVRRLGPSRLLVPLLVLAGGWIAGGQLATPPLVWWAALAAFCYATAGTAVGAPGGDLFVFLGVVVGTVAAMLVGGGAVAVGLAGFGALAAVHALGRRGHAARLLRAALAGLPLMYGALAAGRPADGILPWTLAAWIQLVRELIDDVEREPGPRSRLETVTGVLALAFVPASLIWPARAGYGVAYFLVAMFADLALLAVGTRLLVGRVERLSVLVHGAMALGLIALVAGKVT